MLLFFLLCFEGVFNDNGRNSEKILSSVKYFVLCVASVVTASYFVAPLLTVARMYKRGSYSEVPAVCK